MSIEVLGWSLFGFLCGALPFSVWIGRYGLHTDIRQYGDKNPGATNVLRAGGRVPFIIALLLDIGKGVVPAGLAYHFFGWYGWEIVPVALAPPLGHAFSPFLNGRGGKAIATAFGVWIGLTVWKMSLVSAAALVPLALLIIPSGWAVMATLGVMLVALIVWLRDPVLLGVWLTHSLLLIWTHRADLRTWPALRRKPGIR